jgi:hypothetical protein
MSRDWWPKSRYWWEAIKRPPWIKALFSLALLVGFLLWPVSYPIVEPEVHPESSQILPLSIEHPIKSVVPVPDHPIVEVIFISNDTPRAPVDTILVFEAHLMGSDQQRLASYTLNTTFKEVYDSASQTIAFPIENIPATTSANLEITLSAPRLSRRHAIAVRPQQTAPTTAAIIMKARRPLSATAWRYIMDMDREGEDIYYSWQAGATVLRGDNPYTCILQQVCPDKPPIYLPLFYQLSALSQKAGLKDYVPWIHFWKVIFILAAAGIAAVVWSRIQRRDQTLLATAAALFILFNRWTLYVLHVGQTDLLALLFLVVAVVLFSRRPKTALILLGISLAIKQVAIFLIPLFLIAAWYSAAGPAKQRLKRVGLAAVFVAFVPLLSALPFIIDNAPALAAGLSISAKRTVSDFGVAPLGWILTLSGRENTYLTLGLLLVLYAAALKTRMSLVTGSLLTFFLYVAFYSVNFHQYFVWLVPFVPLAASESASYLKELRHRRSLDKRMIKTSPT